MTKKLINESNKIQKIQDNKTIAWGKNSKWLSFEIIEKLNDDIKIREYIAQLLGADIRPDKVYKKVKEIILGIDFTKTNLSEDDKKFFNEKCYYLNSYNENHYFLAETEIKDSKQSAIIQYANDLIKEYDCKTPSEKALCEIVTNNYFQILRINAKMVSTMNACEYLSDTRNNYINALSKELERANRSYLIALNTLREMKSPQMNINIKTKNAYIWTNQQFNNNQNQDENIKS